MPIDQASIGKITNPAPYDIYEPLSKYRNNQLVTGPVTLSFDKTDGLLIAGLSRADEEIAYTEDHSLEELNKRLAEGAPVCQIGTSQDADKLFKPAGMFANMTRDLRDQALVDRVTQQRELMILRPDFHSDLFSTLQVPLPSQLQQYRSLRLFAPDQVELWWEQLNQKYLVNSELSHFFIHTSQLYEFPQNFHPTEPDDNKQYRRLKSVIHTRTMAFELAAQLATQNRQRQGDQLLANKAAELTLAYKKLEAADLKIDELQAQIATLEHELSVWWREVFAASIKAGGKWAGLSLGKEIWSSLRASDFLSEKGVDFARAFQAMVDAFS